MGRVGGSFRPRRWGYLLAHAYIIYSNEKVADSCLSTLRAGGMDGSKALLCSVGTTFQ